MEQHRDSHGQDRTLFWWMCFKHPNSKHCLPATSKKTEYLEQCTTAIYFLAYAHISPNNVRYKYPRGNLLHQRAFQAGCPSSIAPQPKQREVKLTTSHQFHPRSHAISASSTSSSTEQSMGIHWVRTSCRIQVPCYFHMQPIRRGEDTKGIIYRTRNSRTINIRSQYI